MNSDKTSRQNRVREALGRLYDQHPPYFREYLRRFEEDPTSRVFAPLAEAYRRLGRIDEAIDICREGLEHHPDFHGGRVALAKCYVDKKMFAQARVELDRVVQAVPENLLAQRLLGDTYIALRDNRAALHCYKMALLLSPSDVVLAEKVHALEKESPQSYSEEDPFERAPVEAPAEESIGDELPPIWATDAPIADSSRAKPAKLTRPGSPGTGHGGEPKHSSRPVTAPAEPDFHEPERTDSGETSSLPGMGAPQFHSPEPINAPAEFSLDEGASASADIDSILGVQGDDGEDDSFKIEHVSSIFVEESSENKKEITTETLADLYFSQGQFERSLRIFEKLHSQRATTELARKINACRAKLGVDREALIRARQMETLRAILKKVQDERSSFE